MYKAITGLKDCYECGVCAAVCPVGIIRFETDGEGFYRPVVYEGDKCINCSLCNGSCAMLSHGIPAERKAIAAFSGYSKDDETRLSCSSGGAAYEFARDFVKNGGGFCGVRYNTEKRMAEHYHTADINRLDESRGSKYIQSFSPEGFKAALGEKSGRNIIFGTPCQIASIRKYLKITNNEDRFTLVDFFCHGVPPLSLWQKYVEINDGTLGKADEIIFRDKRNGWQGSYQIRGKLRGKEVYISSRPPNTDPFYKFFLGKFVLSLPCYTCPFRKEQSAADVRVGDMWGKKYSGDRKGISVILAMTGKGLEILKQNDTVVTNEETICDAIGGQTGRDHVVPPNRKKLLRALVSEKSLNEIYCRNRLQMEAATRYCKIVKLLRKPTR